MSFRFMKIRVFAFIFTFFVNFIPAVAQTEASLYQLSAGTTLRVRMDNEINSKVSGVDDTFTMTLAVPVLKSETVILPTGTIIEGRITAVKRAAHGGRNGNLKMSFQTLRLANGDKRAIEGILTNELKVESGAATNALMILGGTAIGGIVGAISKAENGWLLGAGLGAGTGTGIAFLRKGREVGIKADEEFEIKLTKNVNLPVQDF